MSTGSGCNLVSSGISTISGSAACASRGSLHGADAANRDDSAERSTGRASSRSRHKDFHSSVRAGSSSLGHARSSWCSDNGDSAASHSADGRKHHCDFTHADVCFDRDARSCCTTCLPGDKHHQRPGSGNAAEHSGLHAELLLLLLPAAVPGSCYTSCSRSDGADRPCRAHSTGRD